MIRDHWHTDKRSAFTMVELLVVLLIIAILVSLISSAVIRVLNKIPEVQTRTEITQLATAMQSFMTDYNLTNPPPSLLILNEYTPLLTPTDGNRSGNFLTQVFGKNVGPTDWNGNGLIDGPPTGWVLQGHQCLVFYLGGIPSAAGPMGFSTNNMKPSYGSMTALGEVMGKRKGPYMQFVPSRLAPGLLPTSLGFFSYLDPWQVKLAPMPYVYFSSYGINNGYSPTDCSGVVFTDLLGTHYALPYWTGTSGVTLTYTYSNTYQIISAGKDGKFGYNPTPGLLPQPNNLWFPASGAIGTGLDDQANFSSTLLGSGQN